MDNSILECNIEAVANNVADIPKAIMKAQLVALLVKKGNFNETVRRFVPSWFGSRHRIAFQEPAPQSEDYSDDGGDIQAMDAWKRDPHYDLPEHLIPFQNDWKSFNSRKDAFYADQDLAILKRYLEYLANALI